MISKLISFLVITIITLVPLRAASKQDYAEHIETITSYFEPIAIVGFDLDSVSIEDQSTYPYVYVKLDIQQYASSPTLKSAVRQLSGLLKEQENYERIKQLLGGKVGFVLSWEIDTLDEKYGHSKKEHGATVLFDHNEIDKLAFFSSKRLMNIAEVQAKGLGKTYAADHCLNESSPNKFFCDDFLTKLKAGYYK